MFLMSSLLKAQIIEQLDHLPDAEQRRVLEFARSLASSEPVGVPGKDLLPFAGLIEADDLQRMAQAIEEGCEKVDVSEW